MSRLSARVLATFALLPAALLLSCSDSSSPPALTSITVSPGTLTLTFVGDTGTLTAALLDEQGGSPDLTVTWSSSDPGVAEVSSSGVVTARSGGVANVTASAGGLTSAPVTVTVDQQVSTITVDQPALTFASLGETRTVSATATDQGGAPVSGVTFNWISTDPDVITVSQDGTVTAEGNGSANLRASAEGVNSANVPVTVRQVAVFAALTSSTEVMLSAIGETSQITLEARDALDRIIAEPVGDFTSSDPAVAAVSGSGVVTAVGNGQASIGITVDEVPVDPVTVSVEQVATSVSVAPEQLIFQSPGDAEQLTAEARDANGNAVAGLEFAWSSSDQGVATVDATGTTVTVTAEAEGIATVTATSGELTSNNVEIFVGSGGVTELSSGERITELAGPAGLQRFYSITVPAGAGELHIATGGGTAFDGSGSGDLDLFARFGEMPTNDFDDPDQFFSGNPANAEWIEIIDPAPGEWFILIDGFVNPNTGTGPGYADVDFTVRVRDDEAGFDVEMAFVSTFTANQEQIIRQAGDRWEPVVPPDKTGLWIQTQPGTPLCGIQGLDMNDYVDDMGIFVGISDFDGDGEGGTLAAASPCIIRTADGLTIVGVMLFDEADIDDQEASGQLFETAVHEIGHVLGIGTIWNSVGLLQGAGTDDPIFTGPLTLEAFDDVGGTSYSGQKVPVENEGGPGSVDSHWRETVFGSELMSSVVDAQVAEPMSIVTIQSLADIGYTVEIGEAEAYQLPGSGGAGEQAATATTEAMRLVDDILWIDVFSVDEDGTISLVRQGKRVDPITILR